MGLDPRVTDEGQANRARLLGLLPDIPRWCETRGALLEGDCELFGEGGNRVVRIDHHRLLSVIGEPAPAVLRAALAGAAGEWTLICAVESGSHWADLVPGWSLEDAVLHALVGTPAEVAPPTIPAQIERVREPAPGLLDHLPPRLEREIAVAVERYPLFVAWVEERAVAFCYAGSATETLWDVSIETLAEFRRSGLATACARRAIRSLAREGRSPVWGAVESNLPSLRLAVKLGFHPVDRLAVLEGSIG